MDVVLSSQSHVVFGCVGNKAAVYPLQTMGFDVWPVHTVQFSNHTGYGKWKGEIFSADHIKNVIDGVFDIGQAHQCKAVLSGYMGSAEICAVVSETVKRFKTINKDVLYLCDPVIGNSTCYVSPEVLHFFKNNLEADIITPNTYEAETLSGLSIHSRDDLERVADFFHHKGIKVVFITGIKLQKDFFIFASNGHDRYAVDT